LNKQNGHHICGVRFSWINTITPLENGCRRLSQHDYQKRILPVTRGDGLETEMMHNKNGQINIVLHDRRIKSIKENEQSHQHNNPFIHIDEEFSSFIGLDKLKQSIKEIYAAKTINDKRQQNGLANSGQVLHMLFKGNPGTGKTTVARKLAKAYFNMNLLSKGHFIEAERADLVGEYIGQTAQKTRKLIEKSLGGILFIDEAYSLARGGEKDFGKEAIDTLVTHMENNHHDFALILAGYPAEMDEFLLLNPGLQSRFPFRLDFKDFTVDELIAIAKQMVAEREYEMTMSAEWKLRTHLLRKTVDIDWNFSNARYVRNLIEHSIRIQAVRLMGKDHVSIEDLVQLTDSDIDLDGIE